MERWVEGIIKWATEADEARKQQTYKRKRRKGTFETLLDCFRGSISFGMILKKKAGLGLGRLGSLLIHWDVCWVVQTNSTRPSSHYTTPTVHPLSPTF